MLAGYEFRLKYSQKATSKKKSVLLSGSVMNIHVFEGPNKIVIPGTDESGTEQQSKFGLYGWTTTQLQKDYSNPSHGPLIN